MKKIILIAKLVLCCWLLAATSSTVFAQPVLRDNGTNVPVMPPICITNYGGTDVQFPDNLNYYDNNTQGGGADQPAGQTFHIPNPMVLTKVAFMTGGDAGPTTGPSLGPKPFWLRLFQVNDGLSATLVASFESQTNATISQNHWMVWTNITCPLISASGNFAYTFGCDAPDSAGWMQIWAVSGNPYVDGQICNINNAGGATAITYGVTGLYDSIFALGLEQMDLPVTTPIVISPTNTIFLGSTVTNHETAGGDTPLYYQWQTDGGGGGALTNIPGALTNFYASTPEATGSYRFCIIVTNMHDHVVYAKTSDVAILTVIPASAPLLTTDIDIYNTNVYAFYGGSVGFHAEFNLGTTPITNQWLYSTTNISSTFSPIANAGGWYYTLTNIQSTSEGFYKLAATNAVGRSNSAMAFLKPIVRPPVPSTIWATNIVVGTSTNIYDTSYAHYVLTNKPWAYWRFDETTNSFTNSMQAYDYSGNNFNATYGNGTHDVSGYVANSGAKDGGVCRALGQYGPQPNDGYSGMEGTPALGTNLCAGFVNGAANSWLTVPALNFNTNTVTFTMWLYTSGNIVGGSTGLLMWHNGLDVAGVGFGSGLDVGFGRSMAELGYTWNTNNPTSYYYHSHLYLKAQTWTFAAWTITPTNTSIYMYYIDNGTGKTNLLKAVQAINNTPESFMGGTTCLGTDNFNTTRSFPGFIDDVAVFTNSLSEDQIQIMFLRSAGLTSGIPPLISVPPSPVTVFQGQPLRMSVNGGGIPVPTWQWQGGTNCTSGSLCFNGIALAGQVNDTSGGPSLGVSGAKTTSLIYSNYNSSFNYFRVIAGNSLKKVTSSWAKVTFIPISGSTNSQWTMNFNIPTDQAGGPNTAYNGRGVLGLATAPGTNWNTMRGGTIVSVSHNLDDGTPGPAIVFGGHGGAGTWYSGGAGGLSLFDQYAEWTTNSLDWDFTGLPSGRYNLALYGIDGVAANHATDFTILGTTQACTNSFQDQNYGPDNTVVFQNLLVTNGLLTVTITPDFNPNFSSSGSWDLALKACFNGAQLQLLSYGPTFTGPFTNNTLAWNYGVLMQATNIMGPWVTNPAASPYTVNPTGYMRFFRVYNPNF